MRSPSIGELIAEQQFGKTPESMLEKQGFADLLASLGVTQSAPWQTVQRAKGVSDLLADMAFPFMAMSNLGVWHGTPHKWTPEPEAPQGRFRLDKIGTGEGAQAYGWGAYFAENPEVAKDYHKTLVRRNTPNSLDQEMAFLKTGDAYVDLGHSGVEADRALVDYAKAGDSSGALEYAGKRRKSWETLVGDEGYQFRDYAKEKARAWAKLEKQIADSGIEHTGVGSTYHLDLPVEDVPLLDWDLPLSQQSEAVRKAVERLPRGIGEKIASELEITSKTGGTVPGNYVYRTLERRLGSKEAASSALQQAGIPGLRYLDQGSRGTGQGTRNYVIWDQDLLNRAQHLDPKTGKPK